MQNSVCPMRGGIYEDTRMDMVRQRQREIVVGMDAHSVKLALFIGEKESDGNVLRIGEVATTVAALEATYRGQVPPGAVTYLEASTNSFSIAGRLRAIGYEAVVLQAEAVCGEAKRDRISDRVDAESIARYGARKRRQSDVWVPDARTRARRGLWRLYEDAVREYRRAYNRLWNYTSQHALPLLGSFVEVPGSVRRHRVTPADVRRAAGTRNWPAAETANLDWLAGRLDLRRKEAAELAGRIRGAVASDPAVLRLTQLVGVGPLVAFGLAAAVGDVRRFPDSKALVRYVGLNPSECSSGEDGGVHAISHGGIPYVRQLLCEAAQCALVTGGEAMHKWARRKRAEGKEGNKIVCALARKTLAYAWHVLMGHPTPHAEPSDLYRRKLLRFGKEIGLKGLQKLGHASIPDFARAVCAQVYPDAKDPDCRHPSGTGTSGATMAAASPTMGQPAAVTA